MSRHTDDEKVEKLEHDSGMLKNMLSDFEQKLLCKLDTLEELQRENHRLQVENCKIAAEMHKYTWILDVLGKVVKKALPISWQSGYHIESPFENLIENLDASVHEDATRS